MAKILFLAHRAPFPPDKGDKIRAFHMLAHLARRHEIWLGAAADDPADLRFLPEAKARFADACFAPLGRARRLFNMAAGAVAGAPMSVARFRHPMLEAWIDQVLDEVRPDVVLVYSSALAQYVIGRVSPQTQVIVDFVDADAEKWRAYASASRAPMRWVYGLEHRRAARFEGRVLQQVAAGVLISQIEADLMAREHPALAGKLKVMANGVDTEYFDAEAGHGDGRSLVLCGRMDYLPNIEGAQWFAREVLPRVRQVCPGAVFRIVGAAPAPAVLALAGLDGVEVTGAVPDVRPYLAQAAVVVAPLRIARGIQNKVLEGLSAARPVVATPQALEGIAARVGEEVLMAADAEAFAQAVLDVLLGRAPAGLGAAGRRFVLRRHRWASQLSVLDELVAQAAHRPSAETAA